VRILVLEHEPDVPTGLLADWAASRCHELDTVAVPALERWPEYDNVQAIVSLGSESSVHASSDRWIGDELEFLRTAHARRVPILGICFGAQALALALGGSVGAEPRAEVTWRRISSQAPELITPGPWFFWHEDRFTLPAGARSLAGTASRTIAFASGASVGVQFHPEADADLVRHWIATGAATLDSHGIDIAMLEQEVDRHGPGARARALDLFDRVAGWWTAVRPPVAVSAGSQD
jgi:GMP synthase-like glutamine amidotransferase